MDSKTLHILVAESDKTDAENLKKCLEKGNYIVDSVVNDGVDAVSVCLKTLPDVVFINEKLELINGFNTASYIRSKGYSGTVIMVTEKYDEHISQSFTECGADGCIVKPVTEKFLLPWLHTKLTRSKDIKSLVEEKQKLLFALESKRLIEAASGFIALSENIPLAKAEKVLGEKAKEKNMTKVELSKIIVSAGEK